jgi:bacillopeptidase F (M6 metalloprotease family)
MWDISFDYTERKSEVKNTSSLAIQSWSKWTEGEIDGKKFMGKIIKLEKTLLKEEHIKEPLS